jgi:MFS family permease
MPQRNICYDLGLEENADDFYSLFISIHYIACGVGALASGRVSSRFGRRGGLIIANMIGITGCFFFLVPTEATLILGRLVTGLSSGLCATIPPLYIKEISPPEISGKTGCVYQIMCYVGVLTGYIIGLPLPIDDYSSDMNKWWMLMLFFPSLVQLFQCFIFVVFFRWETPTYAVIHHETTQLTVIIGELYSPSSIYQFKEKLLSSYEIVEENAHSAANAAYQMTYSEFLFDPRFRKMLVLGISAQICQQWSGNNAILSYVTKIFEAFSTTFTARLFTVLTGLCNLFSTVCSIFIINKVSRKGILSYGALVLGLILIAMGYIAYYQLSVVFALMFISLFNLCYGITLGACTWLYCGEVLTDAGISISCCFAYINLFLLLYTFHIIASFGLCYAFWMYGAVCLSFYVFYSYYLVETKGLTKEEICEVLVTFEKKAKRLS